VDVIVAFNIVQRFRIKNDQSPVVVLELSEYGTGGVARTVGFDPEGGIVDGEGENGTIGGCFAK